MKKEIGHIASDPPFVSPENSFIAICTAWKNGKGNKEWDKGKKIFDNRAEAKGEIWETS